MESIWTAMLGLPVVPVGDDSSTPPSAGLHAVVQISGAVEGAVHLLTTERFARRATALLLETPESALAAADVDDAVAELCNIVGGGVKSLLPSGPHLLSLPSVTSGPHDTVHP